MARYIDADKALLELQKFSFDTSDSYGVGYSDCLTAVEDTLNDLPTEDVVEVVRCKDCKNFIQKGEEYLLGDVYGFCERSRTGYFDDGAEVYGNDFCSYGVKGSD